MIKNTKLYPIFQALFSALLFGASAPISKILLGRIDPVLLAALLYIGSGAGLLIFQILEKILCKKDIDEAGLTRRDFPWLLGAVIFGGILGPIIQMISLKVTPASTASLLLNFEGAATTIIAALFFKENIGKRVGLAIVCILSASVILSWNFTGQWGISLGALGIILACVCWGIDNNFTRNISAKNPYTIVMVKGLGAGTFSLILSMILGSHLPDFKIVFMALLLGFLSYGFSTVLFVFAMRNLGSARTSAFFSAAPFISTILSFILLGEVPGVTFAFALPLMIAGTVLIIRENHSHMHVHLYMAHEHRHCHTDGHHNHHHPGIPDSVYHTHYHVHERMEHCHPHTPDLHHRHAH